MTSKLVPAELRGDGDLRDLPTNSRIFGVVRVSTSHERQAAPLPDRDSGAYLNVQVTRDRFIDNASMNDLRGLVRWGLDYYAYLASARKYRQGGGTPPPIPPTDPVFDEIRQNLTELKGNVPKPAVARLERVETQVEQLFDIEKLRVKRSQRERILLGALATAGTGAIALEHELGKELTALRRAADDLSALKASPQVTLVRESLESLITRIVDARKLFSPLMEPENRDHVDRMRAKPIVDGIVGDLKPLLRGVQVDTSQIDGSLLLPLATRAAWAAILQNVVVNAINATIDTPQKLIRISAGRVPGRQAAKMVVEDNGIGVDLDDAEILFEPFERRMELSSDRKRLGLGGVGLGLTIVRMIADSVDCKVDFVEPSDDMSTAVEISWKATDDDKTTSRTHSRRRH
jgi:signal transduction histidine kinase